MNFIFAVFFLIIVFRFSRFATTPFLKKIGFYKYYSPMFMTMPLSFNTYDLHLGTSWDIAKAENINSRVMMINIAQGLLKLAEAVESGKLKRNSVFKGNTFYLKGATIERFGFTTRKMNLLEFLLFVINYSELCILNSIIKKKIVFIPWENVLIASCKGSDIVENKSKFYQILTYLKRAYNSSSDVEKMTIKHSVSNSSKKVSRKLSLTFKDNF